MLEIRILPIARSDLSHIWLFVAEDNIAAADRLMIGFQNRFNLLARNSELGEQRIIGNLPACRCFSLDSYVIYYRVIESELFILRVLHGARDQDATLTLD